MSSLGAVLELYAAFKSSKEPKSEGSQPKLEPDDEESIHGYLDNESEWHNVINTQEWDALSELIQGFDYEKYKPKEPQKKKRRLRVVVAAVWIKNKVKAPKDLGEPPASPLLAINEQGHTPLHLAVINSAPDKSVIRMVFCDRRAALVADEEGKLPLHWSCILERDSSVTDRLIRSNFHHMQRTDHDGKTPLCYAVLKAIERKNADDKSSDYWGIPRSKEEAAWQERQDQIWSKVRFVLLSYSTRRKVYVDAEKDLLLQILEAAAPPGIVEVSILAAQGILKSDPRLASSALRLFLKRNYPIKNLQLLLHHFPQENVESMEAARKLLTDYYYLGSRRHSPKKLTFREEMEKHALDPTYKRSLACQEWWKKIQCLLRVCGHQNSTAKKEAFRNEYLLHAALTNSDTPPSLVQLLMVMAPDSIRLQHPFNNSLLIHLICRNWKYNLYPHSKKLGVEVDVEEPPMTQVLKIVLASDPTLTRKRHRSRLPLHDAIFTSKSVEFLEVLVQRDPQSLAVRDPQSKLYPFQMSALRNLNKNVALWAHVRYSNSEWLSLKPEERAAAVDEAIEEQNLEQLNTIFYLLRRHPAVVFPTCKQEKVHKFRDTHGKGMVSTHYLGMAYAHGKSDEFILIDANYKLIEEAIEHGRIPENLEAWWTKLKFWIRYCYSGARKLPNDDDYLLHAASANPDVPPIIIELLVAMYPQAAALPVGGGVEYPLHIASAAQVYEAQYYEAAPAKSTIKAIYDAFPRAAIIQSPLGTPLQIARARRTRSIDELRFLGDKSGVSSILDSSIHLEERKIDSTVSGIAFEKVRDDEELGKDLTKIKDDEEEEPDIDLRYDPLTVAQQNSVEVESEIDLNFDASGEAATASTTAETHDIAESVPDRSMGKMLNSSSSMSSMTWEASSTNQIMYLYGSESSVKKSPGNDPKKKDTVNHRRHKHNGGVIPEQQPRSPPLKVTQSMGRSTSHATHSTQGNGRVESKDTASHSMAQDLATREEEAATRLQSIYRGSKARERVAGLVEELITEMEKLALEDDMVCNS